MNLQAIGKAALVGRAGLPSRPGLPAFRAAAARHARGYRTGSLRTSEILLLSTPVHRVTVWLGVLHGYGEGEELALAVALAVALCSVGMVL